MVGYVRNVTVNVPFVIRMCDLPQWFESVMNVRLEILQADALFVAVMVLPMRFIVMSVRDWRKIEMDVQRSLG